MTVVAAVQLDPVVGDSARNRRTVADRIADAFGRGASIVVVPELATSGYVFRDRDEARSLAIRPDDDIFAEWAALASTAPGDGVVIGGFAELGEDDAVYNSAAVVDPSGVRAVYRKVHLWDREKEVFTPGDAAPPVVDTPHGRIGVMICFDLEFPEWTRLAGLAGADLLAVPTNWPLVDTPPGERPAEQRIAVAAALVNRMAIACADRFGVERGVEWTQGTAIVSPAGFVVAETGPGPGVALADLDLPAARDKRLSSLVDLFGDRRPDLYGHLASQGDG
jgi:predicted amidohydrolase